MHPNEGRTATALALAEELLSDIELSRIAAAQLVLKASRLARLTRDIEAQEWIGYEISGYPHDGTDADLLANSNRWVDREEGTAYTKPLSHLSAIAETQRSKLAMMSKTSFAGDYIVIASREHQAGLNSTADAISTLTSIEGTVTATVHAWVTRTYHELVFSDLQADLFAATQAEIDAQLIPHTGSALAKIEAISERLRDGDPESISHAMSTVRRLITAAADSLFPPSDEPFLLGEQPLSVKANNVLNRLNAYVAGKVESTGRRDRIRHTIKDVWERASAGDHTDIDVVEARFVFLQSYIALGEVLRL
ncbi:MAG: hypothetical protein M3Y42_00910 [Actinomycetota bacterium]|nr:hypothetical protein [Actinomycetota bacterium]